MFLEQDRARRIFVVVDDHGGTDGIITLDVLLKRFLESRQHLFLVPDASGPEIGMVILEDVVEEIPGEDLSGSRDATGRLLKR